MMKQKMAFTLIELLSVIAIIAILAAILFPVFAAAREKARQTTCASNEKQLGVAFLQYAEDYDEMFPTGSIDVYPQSYPAGMGWDGQIYSYVDSAAVYVCPDDPVVSSLNPTVSYGYNQNIPLLANSGSGNNLQGAISKFSEAAKTVLLFECRDVAWATVTTYEAPCTGAWVWTPPANAHIQCSPAGTGYGPMYDTDTYNAGDVESLYDTGGMGGRFSTSQSHNYAITGRHNGGALYLLADGHVKFFFPNLVSCGSAAKTPTSAQDGDYAGESAGTEGNIGGVASAATFSPI